jgi:hypothetical protein
VVSRGRRGYVVVKHRLDEDRHIAKLWVSLSIYLVSGKKKHGKGHKSVYLSSLW